MIALPRHLLAIAAVIAGATVVGEVRYATRQRARLDALQQQNDHLNRQAAQLLAERDNAHRARLLADPTPAAPPALPASAATARAETTDPAVLSWLERIRQIKALLHESPEQSIPEIELLTDEDWLDFVRRAQLYRDPSRRNAVEATFGQLREKATSEFGNRASGALRRFAAAHQNTLPNDLRELAPYFQPAIDPAILKRYTVLQTGRVADLTPGATVIAETSLVDELSDMPLQITSHSLSPTLSNGPWWKKAPSAQILNSFIEQATDAFAKANPGQTPNDPAQLMPHLVGYGVDLPTLQKFWHSPLRRR